MGPNVDRIVKDGLQIRPLAEHAANAIAIIDPLAAALGASPLCAATPECGALRDHVQTLVALRQQGFFDQIAGLGDELTAQTAGSSVSATITQLQGAADTLDRSMAVLGGPGADLPAQIARLQGGIGQLASGARALAVGVHTLVDSNLEMLGGMSQIAAQLQDSARGTAGSDAAAGFYLPPTALRDQQFTQVARQFISPDGRTARFLIESGFDPYTAEAMTLGKHITDVATAATPNTSLSGATVSVAGFPAINSDIQRLMVRDFLQLAIATLVIVALILVALLRAVLAPIYLLATVVLNYAAALGMGVLVFQYGLGHDIAWPAVVHHPRGRGRRLQHAAHLAPSRGIGQQHPRGSDAHGRQYRLGHHIGRTDLRGEHVRADGGVDRNHGPNGLHHRLRSAARHVRRAYADCACHRDAAGGGELVADAPRVARRSARERSRTDHRYHGSLVRQ
jgi:RND superfamily putative drug exporter